MSSSTFVSKTFGAHIDHHSVERQKQSVSFKLASYGTPQRMDRSRQVLQIMRSQIHFGKHQVSSLEICLKQYKLYIYMLLILTLILRFDAELADRSRLPTVLSRLCDRRIKFPGISHLLIVRAVETKPDFPTRHEWDSYFRNSKDMNELKPGERPDTLHIENLPVEWLTEPGEKYPSENVLKKIFSVFGEVARVDLPVTDPSRINHGVGICDAYVQYRDYKAFAKAMDALRGNKLAYITDTKSLAANIKVDFDKTKHMALESITKRHERRDRFVMRQKAKDEEERIKKEKEMKKLEEEK